MLVLGQQGHDALDDSFEHCLFGGAEAVRRRAVDVDDAPERAAVEARDDDFRVRGGST